MGESTQVEGPRRATPRTRLRSDPNLVGNLEGSHSSVERAKRYIAEKETERRGEQTK